MLVSTASTAIEEIFHSNYAYNNLYTIEIVNSANESARNTSNNGYINNLKKTTTWNNLESRTPASPQELLNNSSNLNSTISRERLLSSTEDINNYLKFQSPSVVFNGESLNLERNAATKKFQITGYTRTDTLTVEWREADDWRVKRYHENWIALFYDRDNDQFVSHDNAVEDGLYRMITIKLGNGLGIRFYNVIPQNNGNISLTWNPSPSIVSHSISYYIEDWEWLDNLEEESL